MLPNLFVYEKVILTFDNNFVLLSVARLIIGRWGSL